MTAEEKREVIEHIENPAIPMSDKGAAIRQVLNNRGSFSKYDITRALEGMWRFCFEERICLKEEYRQTDMVEETATAAGGQ